MINTRKAQKFCKDDISKIENYELAKNDPNETWDLHHRLELTLDGEFAHSREELKRLDMYYNRPYFELIFLTRGEHRRLHSKARSDETKRKMSESLKGKPLTDEHRRKISEAMKGENGPFYGKSLTDEHRQNIANAMKGKNHSEETRKKMSEAAKRRWLRQA